MATIYVCSECGHEVGGEGYCEEHPNAQVHSGVVGAAVINRGGAKVVSVANLSDAEVNATVELIGNDPSDALRERIHGQGHETERAYLEAYCTAYKAQHGAAYATP